MNEVIVIGAGASGLVAGIKAAQQGAKVTILEKNNKVGKKLLATGNGRCNMTNSNISEGNYRSQNIDFVKNIINKYPTSSIRSFFENISIKTRDINGYIYPYSQQAKSVVDKLYNECNSLGVNIVTEVEAKDISFNDGGDFTIITSKGKYEADKVIISTGLVAGIGIKGEKIDNKQVFALKIADKAGHRVYEIVPGLTGLKCENSFLDKVSGVRWECKISSYSEGELLYEDVGEAQFAEYGVSGIVAFQNASFVSKSLEKDKKTEIVVDFMPEMRQNELKTMLKETLSKFSNMSLYDILSGIFNSKLVTYFFLNTNINGSVKAHSFRDMDKLVKIIKSHRMLVTGTRGYEFAQVCAGGIDTLEIHETMESKKLKKLYFTGEALDVDGMCGGYNLHFAFATGIEAGTNAGME